MQSTISALRNISSRNLFPRQVTITLVTRGNKSLLTEIMKSLQVRQKARAAQSPAAAALAPDSDPHLEMMPPAAPQPGAGASSSAGRPKTAKEWSDIDLSSPQP